MEAGPALTLINNFVGRLSASHVMFLCEVSSDSTTKWVCTRELNLFEDKSRTMSRLQRRRLLSSLTVDEQEIHSRCNDT